MILAMVLSFCSVSFHSSLQEEEASKPLPANNVSELFPIYMQRRLTYRCVSAWGSSIPRNPV